MENVLPDPDLPTETNMAFSTMWRTISISFYAIEITFIRFAFFCLEWILSTGSWILFSGSQLPILLCNEQNKLWALREKQFHLPPSPPSLLLLLLSCHSHFNTKKESEVSAFLTFSFRKKNQTKRRIFTFPNASSLTSKWASISRSNQTFAGVIYVFVFNATLTAWVTGFCDPSPF